MTNVWGKIRGIPKRHFAERERVTENVKKEDFLIKQIDEFKEKAKQLQSMLDSKEMRVQELQQVVEQREKKAESLQGILQEKQQEADGITKGVEAYAQEIGKNLEEQITKLQDYLAENKKDDEQLTKIQESIETCIAAMDAMKGELSEKIHSENVKCYRNIQTLVEELDGKLEKVELGERSMKTMKGYLKAVVFMGIVNLIVLVGFFLYELGILDYIM